MNTTWEGDEFFYALILGLVGSEVLTSRTACQECVNKDRGLQTVRCADPSSGPLCLVPQSLSAEDSDLALQQNFQAFSYMLADRNFSDAASFPSFASHLRRTLPAAEIELLGDNSKVASSLLEA